jgi:hypothetical protein
MQERGTLPRALQGSLLEEEVGEELLLYDQDRHTAHCLSPTAACVWRHCDGEHDVAELAVLATVSEDLVVDVLHELRKKNLLAAEPELARSTVPGESRREAIRRVARYGAAVAAAPLVVSATAATPAMASSGEEAKKCVTPSLANCCRCANVCYSGTATGFPTLQECKEKCESHSELRLEFLELAKCP